MKNFDENTVNCLHWVYSDIFRMWNNIQKYLGVFSKDNWLFNKQS